MPIPKPRKDEDKDSFIKRCMANDVMNEEYPDNKQRAAICNTSWRDKKQMDKIFINTQLETKASKEEDRIVEFIASKEVVDRGGDLIKIKGMDVKSFKDNPIILWSHKREELPIGKAVSVIKSGDELKIKVKFASPEEYSFADTVYKLVKGGYLKASSIGIIPDYKTMEYKEVKNGTIRIINKSMLFEMSIVPIPMNQDALATGKVLTKAIDDGIIDEIELKEYELMSKEVANEHKEEIGLTTKELEIIELRSRVTELEVQLKDQELEEELEDNIYKELYDEYKDVLKPDKDNQDEDIYDSILKEYFDK